MGEGNAGTLTLFFCLLPIQLFRRLALSWLEMGNKPDSLRALGRDSLACGRGQRLTLVWGLSAGTGQHRDWRVAGVQAHRLGKVPAWGGCLEPLAWSSCPRKIGLTVWTVQGPLCPCPVGTV